MTSGVSNAVSDPVMSAGADPIEVQRDASTKSLLDDVSVRDPRGRVWAVRVELWLPWTYWDAGPDRRTFSQRAGASLLEELFILTAPIWVWLAQTVVRVLTWPIWFAWRTLSGRGLTLLIHDHKGQRVEAPGDLPAGSARTRRAELARRIADGSFVPSSPWGIAEDDEPARARAMGLEGGAAGQPFVRRRRPRAQQVGHVPMATGRD